MIQILASLAACSFVVSSTSLVAKLCRQKYCHGMPAVRITTSNVSFFNPENLIILISTRTSEIMQRSGTSDISGIGKITLSWKYRAYLPHPISVVFLQASLWNLPGGWCFAIRWSLSWLYRTAWRNCFLCLSWRRDWKRRPNNFYLFLQPCYMKVWTIRFSFPNYCSYSVCLYCLLFFYRWVFSSYRLSLRLLHNYAYFGVKLSSFHEFVNNPS